MAKLGVSPRGNVIVTSEGARPPHSASSAAFTAAVAQAPVVQPRRRVFSGVSLRGVSLMGVEHMAATGRVHAVSVAGGKAFRNAFPTPGPGGITPL